MITCIRSLEIHFDATCALWAAKVALTCRSWYMMKYETTGLLLYVKTSKIYRSILNPGIVGANILVFGASLLTNTLGVSLCVRELLWVISGCFVWAGKATG